MLPQPVSPPRRYLELDALRGVAAVMVVFFHFTMGRPEGNLGFRLGATGVDLFFIISGFVIFMTLSKTESASDFVANRISRLYPTYWAAVTFTFLVKCLHVGRGVSGADVKQYLGNLTMFQFYLSIPDLDDPYWTMILEMTFYVVILLVFLANWQQYLEPVGVIGVLGLAVGSHYFSYHKLIYVTYYYVPFLTFAPLFLAGILFYKIYVTRAALPARYLGLAMCLLSQFWLFKFGRSHNYISEKEYLLMLVVYFGLFTLFVRGNLAFLVSRVTLFFGKISFALYLVHEYVSLNVVIPFLTQRLHLNFWLAAGAIAFPLTVLLAFLITRYIEVPVGKRMRARLHVLLA
jgi:peptidoglycan/LPS O-acetylase OafA/YrhL